MHILQFTSVHWVYAFIARKRTSNSFTLLGCRPLRRSEAARKKFEVMQDRRSWIIMSALSAVHLGRPTTRNHKAIPSLCEWTQTGLGGPRQVMREEVIKIPPPTTLQPPTNPRTPVQRPSICLSARLPASAVEGRLCFDS